MEMASMNSWCYFFLVEIIMAKQKTKNIMNRFLQGWQQIFGGDRQEAVQNKFKPFPQNHYFRPEELDYLSKNSNLTTIEKWAVATGKWAFEQSKDKFSDCKYASVKWQDGLMATWVDGRIIPDTPSRQAEKLALLKEDGFEIPDKYEKVITNYEASRLVGNYFFKGNDVVKVEDYDKGHLVADTPKLILQRWNKDNLSSAKETIEYVDFKEELGRSIVTMSDIDKQEFVNKLTNKEQGKQLFNKVIESINKSYPPVLGGILPLELQKVHEVNAFDGKLIPTSWSIDNDNTMRVVVFTDNSNKTDSIVIDENTAHRYKSVLDTIDKVVEKERVNGIIYSLASLLGNDFGENKIYAKENNGPLLPTNDGVVNAVVATKDGRTIAFNLDKHKEITLTGKDPNFLMVTMLNEAEKERQHLRDLVSIPQMKDYVESMTDKEKLLSGEWDYIPSKTTLSKLFCEYQRNEEKFHSYTHSSFPLAPEDRNEMLANLASSTFAFNTEMKKMIDAYDTKSYSFSESDVKRLEQLDLILDNTFQKPTIRHHKVTKGETITETEAALRDSLVNKMRRSGMDVITDVDEAKIAHQEASNQVKEMGTRTLKRMNKIGKELEGRELTQEQQAVVGVYTGKADNLYFKVSRDDKDKSILMRQGNDFHAGAKHSVYGHYDTNKGVITADDILLIPIVIAKGDRKVSANGKIEYKYNNPQNNVSYKVITQSEKGHEVFNDFYTNKKVRPSVTSSLSEETKTNLIAHNNNGQTLDSAKVQQNDETTKKDDHKLSEFKTSKGEIWGFTTDGKIYLDPRVYIKGDKRIGNGKSVDVLPLREQRGQQTSETRFIDPLLLKAKTDGRWHTQEHMEKKVYKEYGSILAASKGLTVSDNGNESVPMDMSGHKYSGTTAMMLNIASRNHGYEVPVFLNLATMNANGIRVNENAVAIPVITKNGVENVYNIDQTDYPMKHPQEYSNMKLNQVLESRLSSENKDAIESLVNNNRFTTKTSFDSSVGSASYSTNDNTIHVAPVGEYDKKDGFLQDLSEGLVMRTRKSEPVSSRFENILKEGLIVHLGSGLVGQKYGYDVGETAGSKFWKERLKNDPNYTKTVLKAAEKSSDKIIDYVDKLQKGQSQSSNLDMRSTTPIDIDIDGNGIVESDENLAPDKKQGSDEEKDNNQEESHHQEHRYHRGR